MSEVFTEERRATKLRDDAGIKISPELKKAFPAIFNTRRSVNVSEDYQLYRSDQMIDIMAEKGLVLVEVGQERIGWSRKRQPHTQIHTMRFRDERFSRAKFTKVGDCIPELLIKNSHDGRCLFNASAGVYRLVCSNGMVVPDMRLGNLVRRHFGEANAFAKVREILADMPKAVARVSQVIDHWEAIRLTEKEQVAMARELMKVKMPSGSIRGPEWLKPEALLEHRRDADAAKRDGSRSLWLTFNVLQEALTNATVTDIREGQRPRSIRPITGVVDNIGMNQRLWSTADAYAAKMAKKQGLILDLEAVAA